MSPVARSRQAHGFSTKKKLQRIRKSNPSRRWQRNQIGGREIKPQCPILPIQSKSAKANQTQQATANQTQRDRGVYLKKKSPIHNSKPNPSKPNPVTHHDHVTATLQLTRARRRCRRSPLIADRRSQIALPLLRCSLRPFLKVFLSFSLSLSLK